MDMDCWFSSTDPPDFNRYFLSMDRRIPSWTLGNTIWSPNWKDVYPPGPLLCSAWGGLGDTSRIGRWTRNQGSEG
jgi:hypothetical protein